MSGKTGQHAIDVAGHRRVDGLGRAGSPIMSDREKRDFGTKQLMYFHYPYPDGSDAYCECPEGDKDGCTLSDETKMDLVFVKPKNQGSSVVQTGKKCPPQYKKLQHK